MAASTMEIRVEIEAMISELASALVKIELSNSVRVVGEVDLAGQELLVLQRSAGLSDSDTIQATGISA